MEVRGTDMKPNSDYVEIAGLPPGIILCDLNNLVGTIFAASAMHDLPILIQLAQDLDQFPDCHAKGYT